MWETQSKGTKRKRGPTAEPPPKKAQMPSAALGKAPPELGMETPPVASVPVSGEASAAIALGASSLEDYLTGRDLPASETIPIELSEQPPTSRLGTEGMGMGGFLEELRGMLSKSGQKKALIPMPVPRRSSGKWKPMLGKPTISTATAASMLVPQQRAPETSVQPGLDPVPMEVVVDTPRPQEGPSAPVSVPTGLDVRPAEPTDPPIPDNTQVAAEVMEDVAVRVAGSVQPEAIVVVVHQEVVMISLPTPSREDAVITTPTVALETSPLESCTEVETGLSSQQEPLVTQDVGGVSTEGTESTQERAALAMLQTTGGFDPYGGQTEEVVDDREANNIPSAPESFDSGQVDSGGDRDGTSSDNWERQDSGPEGGNARTGTGKPREEGNQETSVTNYYFRGSASSQVS